MPRASRTPRTSGSRPLRPTVGVCGPFPRAAALARDAVGATAGAALATGLTAYAAVRRDKPLPHPRCRSPGTLTVTEPSTTGAAHRRPGQPRGAGPPVPATTDGPGPRRLRHRDPDRCGRCPHRPLLFASTGDSGVGRFALQVRRRIDAGPLTTMLPMTCASGSMIPRLVPVFDHEYALSRASARGSWHPVGLPPRAGRWRQTSRSRRVGKPPRGPHPPTWVRLLRAPRMPGPDRRSPCQGGRPGHSCVTAPWDNPMKAAGVASPQGWMLPRRPLCPRLPLPEERSARWRARRVPRG